MNNCPVCLDTLIEPHTIIKGLCHHTFCKTCIVQITTKKCPLCRINYNDVDVIHNIALERYINDNINSEKKLMSIIQQDNNIEEKKDEIKDENMFLVTINQPINIETNIETNNECFISFDCCLLILIFIFLFLIVILLIHS